MRHLLLTSVVLAFGGAPLGCGGTVIEDGSGGATSANGTSGASTAHTGVTGTGMSTGTSGPGCDQDADCPKYEVCTHSDELCGKGVKGACQMQNTLPCGGPPACRCNGNVSATAWMVDVSKDPSICSQGTFACGGLMCKKYIEYCIPPHASPAGGGPDQGCLPAPAACTYGIADCDCVSNGGACTDDGQGGVTYNLPVP